MPTRVGTWRYRLALDGRIVDQGRADERGRRSSAAVHQRQNMRFVAPDTDGNWVLHLRVEEAER